MSQHLLIRGDARRIPLANGSVHMCVTSPPYWGLRDYGVPGQLGLEATPDEFVAGMVAVFREVWRVLRPDGTLWVNIGDSYAGGGGFSPDSPSNQPGALALRDAPSTAKNGVLKKGVRTPYGLKPKDLVGIPWRLAFALQSDGWYLRSEIIWAKPNPMPESVTDRPTEAHEQVFLFAKSERYYYDNEAVREPHAEPWRGMGTERVQLLDERPEPGVRNRTLGAIDRNGNERAYNPAGRNLRTVWSIATEAYPGAHFATYPRKLIEPCIKAGTSEKGCCPRCGAPWARVVERQTVGAQDRNGNAGDRVRGPMQRLKADGSSASQFEKTRMGWGNARDLGWQPTCSHGLDPIPCTVFDPFIGSGTSIVVANALGRRGIGCDLSREYLGLAARRIERPHAPIPRPGRSEYHPLFPE